MSTWWLRKFLAAGGVVAMMAALLVVPATAAAGHGNLDAVREATAQFLDVNKAKPAGYLPVLSCFDSPGVGGMGQHLIKGALMDGVANPTEPEALVYEVDGDHMNLVAVEYIVPYSFVPTTATPPRLFGKSFLHNDALSLWVLHAWVWRHNPLGTFTNYNPNVDLCPGHVKS
jgi:hypothetical protein